jgi:hypothetical protein
MGHVVLLGDSIFDNASYVPDRPSVIDQVRQALPHGWSGTLLARDGDIAEDVANQLKGLPADATHLIVSAGGNDALSESSILSEVSCTVGESLSLMHAVRMRFKDNYRAMLRAVVGVGKPAAVCTVYDAIPGLGSAEQAALAGFNEIILREAFSAGLPVIDLRLVFDRSADYSDVSAIEPSAVGGAKIARVIAEVATTHDFSRHRTAIYI